MHEQANPLRTGTAQDAFPVQRCFLETLTAATGSPLALAAMPRSSRTHSATPLRLHLQDCRLAGSHYYDCHKVPACLRPGSRLSLRRQPDNPYGGRAIEVFRRRHKLGYLPRMDNAAAASLADCDNALDAEIIGIDDPNETGEPVRFRMGAERS